MLLLSIIVIFVVHKIKSNNEYNELKDLGYINKYSAGDYDLNIYRINYCNHYCYRYCLIKYQYSNYALSC